MEPAKKETIKTVTADDIEAKLKGAIDDNATDNPHMAIDPTKGKMAVVGDATEIQVPDYKYKIEYEYTPDLVSIADRDKLRYEEALDAYYLDVTYEGKRVKPIYRTKAVVLLTGILADAAIIDTTGYSSDQVDGAIVERIIDKHVEDILELAHIVLGVERDQLEYMTVISMITFFTDLLRNEPNIIAECVNFLSQSRKKMTEKK